MRMRRDGRVKFVALGIFVMVFLFSFLVQYNTRFKNNVDAVSLANFDPGYIISDWRMGNYNAMSESEIQVFLTAKNPCGNYNENYHKQLSNNNPGVIWQFRDGHFICLSEELFGDGEVVGSGETAAHIIWQAAQDYKINPQVLIVLLQKETGLITDPIPNNYDYRKATGFGCPDTAPCSEEYYGFKNQIRRAAALFRTVLDGGWTNYPLGNNYIQYNPNAACGGSVVDIRNLATSALYRYTPYQPNSQTLAAGYGTAHCGAYGNRNFYLYFEDWFGGIKNEKINWVDMSNPRVMTIMKGTLVIDMMEYNTTNQWLDIGKNYYFIRKTDIVWGGERQVCLQRQSDIKNNTCILMSRLSEFEKKDIEVQDYEVIQWTCPIELASLNSRCEDEYYSEGVILKINGVVEINDENYYIKDDEKGLLILEKRLKKKFYYESLEPTLMKLKENSYKYIVGTDEVIQKLNTVNTPIIKIAEKIIINGEVFYRTAVDAGKNDYVISGNVLDNEIFTEFALPRNLQIKKDTNSFNLVDNSLCNNYKAGSIQKYIKKIDYLGKTYFQNEKEINSQCVINADDLMETEYNFNNFNVLDKFSNFLNPRELKAREKIYMINLNNGTTCEDYLDINNIQEYTTKIDINNMSFFRTKLKTLEGSPCAVPANKLVEIN